MEQTATTSKKADTNGDLTEAHELKDIVQELLFNDRRFVGMSAYLSSISFFWSKSIQTACAGAGFIFFNPDFYDKIPPETRKSVVAHEIWHLILRHLERGEGKDEKDYNIAADHVINNILTSEGFTFKGTKPHNDPKYRGMSTETVYDAVHAARKKEKKPKSDDGPPAPTSDQIKDLISQALKGSGKDIDQQIEEDGKKADKAAAMGQQAGDALGTKRQTLKAEEISSNAKRVLTLPLREIFEDWLIDPLTMGKRTFMRKSRRALRGSTFFQAGRKPTLKRENRLTHMVYCLDVSGSIDAAMRQQFYTSAKLIKEVLNPKLMTIILWDTRIQEEFTLTDKQPFEDIHIRSGGGTNLNPVYTRLAELDPEVAVIFTDLEVTIPPEPKWETIWFLPHANMRKVSSVKYGSLYVAPKE